MSAEDPPSSAETAKKKKSCSAPVHDPEFYKLLFPGGDSDTEDEDEDEVEWKPKEKVPVKVLSGLSTRDKRRTYVKGEIVWVLRVVQANRNPHKVLRAPREEDFHRSTQEFVDANEELRGGLFILKSIPSGKGQKNTDCFRMMMVYDGDFETRQKLCLTFTEKQEIKFTQAYQQQYEHNQMILNAIERSIGPELRERDDYKLYLERIRNQDQAVKDFYHWKSKIKDVDPLEYLIRDGFERKVYLEQWVSMDEILGFKLMPSAEEKNLSSGDEDQKDDLPIARDEDLKEDPPIASALETNEVPVPSAVKVTQPQCRREYVRQYQYCPREILEFISKPSTLRAMKEVMLAKVQSARHDLLVKDGQTLSYTLGSRILHLSNSGFLSNNDFDRDAFALLATEVFNKNLLTMRKRLPIKSDYWKSEGFKRDYINHCLIPEATIMYLQKFHGDIPYHKAEALFTRPPTMSIITNEEDDVHTVSLHQSALNNLHSIGSSELNSSGPAMCSIGSGVQSGAAQFNVNSCDQDMSEAAQSSVGPNEQDVVRDPKSSIDTCEQDKSGGARSSIDSIKADEKTAGDNIQSQTSHPAGKKSQRRSSEKRQKRRSSATPSVPISSTGNKHASGSTSSNTAPDEAMGCVLEPKDEQEEDTSPTPKNQGKRKISAEEVAALKRPLPGLIAAATSQDQKHQFKTPLNPAKNQKKAKWFLCEEEAFSLHQQQLTQKTKKEESSPSSEKKSCSSTSSSSSSFSSYPGPDDTTVSLSPFNKSSGERNSLKLKTSLRKRKSLDSAESQNKRNKTNPGSSGKCQKSSDASKSSSSLSSISSSTVINPEDTTAEYEHELIVVDDPNSVFQSEHEQLDDDHQQSGDKTCALDKEGSVLLANPIVRVFVRDEIQDDELEDEEIEVA